MKVTFEFKDQDVEDILITAMERGSNYWYYLDIAGKVFERSSEKSLTENIITAVLEKGEEFDIYDIEESEYDIEEGGQVLGKLSRENIERGIALCLKEGMNPFQEDMDAGMADVFFQYVVMGEVVFA